MNSECAKLERAAMRALEALDGTQDDITTIRVCLAWLAANPSRTGVMRGDSTIFKVLLDLSERVEASHHAASRRMRGSLITDQLPF